MRVTLFRAALLALAFSGALQTAPAQAQATRTWVSGTGDDGAPCTVSAPCKTFQGALSKTAAGGEINCLDSAGFGTLTIDKGVTIDCDVGTAGVLTNMGDGIVVNADPSAVVVLRGLDIDGLNGGANGINFESGSSLHVENCQIRGFVTAGIAATAPAASMVVQDSTLTENGTAGALLQPGVESLPERGGFVATLDRVQITKGSGGGVKVLGGGVFTSLVTISDSVISENAGNGVVAISGGRDSVAVRIARTVIASNGSSGVQSNSTGGGLAAVTLRGSALSDNANGNVNFVGGARLLTFGDNILAGPQGTGFSGPISMQ